MDVPARRRVTDDGVRHGARGAAGRGRADPRCLSDRYQDWHQPDSFRHRPDRRRRHRPVPAPDGGRTVDGAALRGGAGLAARALLLALCLGIADRSRADHLPARAVADDPAQRGLCAINQGNRGAGPMDLRYTADELAFRDEFRAFIRDHLPSDLRERMRLGHAPRKEDTVAWQRILNRRGWAAYSWPKEYGGPGWTPVQRMMFLEENQLAPAPDMQIFNIGMIGPVLIQFGTDEQKRRFLPGAANLDVWWCQGFSEPAAGSDLAALKTAARREGDEYIVNGQKIWTSTAHMADWCFVLVRTDPHAAKRQEGISFLLIDMQTPGITVRPIISIDGTHHLNRSEEHTSEL